VDKGAQELKPLDSAQDRAITVKAFINARYNQIAKITNFAPMTGYLNGKHIPVLYEKLPKTSTGQELRQGSDGYAHAYNVTCYGNTDAEMYLEWLISVVQGSEQAPEETISKAYDQLCRFILILTDNTKWEKSYFLSKPYDWVTKLEEFEADISGMIKDEIQSVGKTLEDYEYKISGYDKQLDEISETLDQRSKDMLVPIEQILTWLKSNSPTIEAMKKEYAGILKTKGRKTQT
jgi:hypothetical protein